MLVRAWGGWVAALVWLGARTIGAEDAVLTVPLGRGELTFLYFDWTWALALLASVLFAVSPPREASAWRGIGILTVVTWAEYTAISLTRYYAGGARAWDLANYVQPMWRAASGLGMTSATYGDASVWADHGALAMFAFAPLTRVADDAATGVLVVQAALASAAIVATYGVARALHVPVATALALAMVLAASRALLHAVRFDFHAECAFPLLFLGAAWARAREKIAWAVAATIAAAALREMAAITIGMLWLYWALRERSGRCALVAGACAVVASFDMLVLPELTGWYSYVALNASAPIDLATGAATTVLRTLSTSLLGWLHPVAWITGAPWILAAALSPKLAVKGIDFQYGFLFVPVATLGAAHVLSAIARHRMDVLHYAACGWLALALATNAPARVSLSALRSAYRTFHQHHEALAALIPPAAFLAADACAAPFAMERPRLTVICRIDMKTLQATGQERWTEPVLAAFGASHMLLRRDCPSMRGCAARQVAEAQQRHGFTIAEQEGPFVLLVRRPRERGEVP